MQKIFTLYRNAFGGMSRAAWLLSLIMLINRSGAMVVPFMTLYLNEELGFSIDYAGLVMAILGVGSLLGSFSGGWLSDRFGHYPVQLFSLLGSGVLFFLLGTVNSFIPFAILSFLLMTVADMLRPANSASIASYARPENLTRAYSLNRLAINLGFAIGPAVGGLLASHSYFLLFIADGSTSILAGVLFWILFSPKRQKNQAPLDTTEQAPGISPWRDKPYMLFIGLVSLFAMCFFQLISVMPLYYRQEYALSESSIGLLLSFNGALVFLVEMILVYWLGTKRNPLRISIVGIVLTGISFFLLNMVHAYGILVAAMAVITFGEMLSMPFMNTFAAERGTKKRRGSYLGMYTMAYSLAFILSPAAGTRIAALHGFTVLWYLVGGFSILLAVGMFAIYRYTLPKPSLLSENA